jgi:AcrR family transcriptional regulator
MPGRDMPRGRRPGTSTTRQALIEAARRRFADTGYGGTTIRTIAADAGVDPALAVHFFGSKRNLFREALAWPFDPEAAVAGLAGAAGTAGERIARFFLETWDAPDTGPALVAVLRGALTHEESARLLREFLGRQVFGRMADAGVVGSGPLGTELAAAHLVGIAVCRYGLGLEPIASAPIDELVARVAPELDRYLSSGSG